MFFVQALVSGVLFLGGAYAGLRFGQWIAPDSIFATITGFTMFPLSFISGMIAWQGFAVIAAIFGAKGKKTAGGRVPPGSIGLFFASIIVCILGGLFVWLMNPIALGIVWTGIRFAVAGVSYGILCWILARIGWLPMMED